MNSSLTALGAAAVVALIGAWVWKLIAITFNYELGLIAWGIGGAIGFTAATLGSRGQNMGVICGVLAFTAIMYGKYLTTAAFQEELISTLTASLTDEELQEAFNTELETAQYYVDNVTTEAETKAFMVDNMYTDAYTVDTVPTSDLEHFQNSTAPRLRELVNNPPTPKQWLESAFSYSTDETSTWTLVKEDFGLLDYLFLFLGIGTAFRLARGDA